MSNKTPYEYSQAAPTVRRRTKAEQTLIRDAQETVQEALKDRAQRRDEKAVSPMTRTEIGRLEYQLEQGYKALAKYDVLMETDLLDIEQERMFLLHQDSIRKLETTLSALKAKADYTKQTDLELAMELQDTGMSLDSLEETYGRFPEIMEALRKRVK